MYVLSLGTAAAEGSVGDTPLPPPSRDYTESQRARSGFENCQPTSALFCVCYLKRKIKPLSPLGNR